MMDGKIERREREEEGEEPPYPPLAIISSPGTVPPVHGESPCRGIDAGV